MEGAREAQGHRGRVVVAPGTVQHALRDGARGVEFRPCERPADRVDQLGLAAQRIAIAVTMIGDA